MRQGVVPKIVLAVYLVAADAADLLAHQHEPAHQFGHHVGTGAVAAPSDAREIRRDLQ